MQHFIRSGAVQTVAQQLNTIKKFPIFTGIILERYWSRVEPETNTLLLAEIDAAVEGCKDAGIDLWFWFQDKQFNAKAGMPTPSNLPYVKIGTKGTPVYAADLADPAVPLAYNKTVQRLDRLFPEFKYFDVSESAPGADLQKFWDEEAWTNALIQRYGVLGTLGSRGGANINYHPNVKRLVDEAYEQGLFLTIGDAQDTAASKYRTQAYKSMQSLSCVTMESAKTHGTIAKQWNWLERNNTISASWTDFLGDEFAIAKVAAYIEKKNK